MTFRMSRTNVRAGIFAALFSLLLAVFLILVSPDFSSIDFFGFQDSGDIQSREFSLEKQLPASEENGEKLSSFSIENFNLPDSQYKIPDGEMNPQSYRLGKLNIEKLDYRFVLKKPVNYTGLFINVSILIILSAGSIFALLTSKISFFNDSMEINAPPLVNKNKIYFKEIDKINKFFRGKPRSIQPTAPQLLRKQRFLHTTNPIQPPVLSPALRPHVLPNHTLTTMNPNCSHEIPL